MSYFDDNEAFFTRAYAMDPKTWDELLDFIGDSPCALATAFEGVQ